MPSTPWSSGPRVTGGWRGSLSMPCSVLPACDTTVNAAGVRVRHSGFLPELLPCLLRVLWRVVDSARRAQQGVEGGLVLDRFAQERLGHLLRQLRVALDEIDDPRPLLV